MKHTHDTKAEAGHADRVMADELFAQAKSDIAADMKSRGIGAIIWDNNQTGFHYPPIVTLSETDGSTAVWKVQGIYRVREALFLIGPKAPVDMKNYYNPNTETRPIVVTLTEKEALDQLGEPTVERGFTDGGDVEQWLSIADAYFEALTLNNDI